MTIRREFYPKPLFEERMKKLIPDYDIFMEYVRKESPNSIRCNTIKISVEELKKRLESKGWQLEQLKKYPQAMTIKNKLNPGELGRSLEHTLGYYYVQEISSMLSIIALNPKEGESFLDITASPGSKTTQAVMHMKNKGLIIANDNKLPRIAPLVSNLEKAGAINIIITRQDAVQLCRKFQNSGIKFDKILVDASCSGEGTLRSSPKTFLMWNIKMIKKLSRLQKLISSTAFQLLKPGGEMVYSTCTHAPEENEEVVDYLVKNFNARVEKLDIPVKFREGITQWEDKTYDQQVKHAARIYPQDNDTEGFFLAKLRKGE